MSKKLVKISSLMIRAAVALTALCAASAFATGALGTAHVTRARVDGNGQGMIFFYQPLGETPAACGQDSSYRDAPAFNATTGRAALAFALTAKATGTPVEVHGTGACTIYGDYVEDFSYGVMLQ